MRQEHKQIVVYVDHHRQRAGPHIYLEVLESWQQSKHLFFDGAISRLIFTEFTWKVAHRMIDPLYIFLQENHGSTHSTSVNF